MDLEAGRGESGLTTKVDDGLSGSPSELRGGWSASDENVRFWPCVEGPAPGVDASEGPENINEGFDEAKKSCAGVGDFDGAGVVCCGCGL